MIINLKSVADVGLAVRATRRSSGIRIDDMAGICKVSKQFVSDVEHGKETVQMGLTLKMLSDLGIHVLLDIPPSAVQMFTDLKESSGLKPAGFAKADKIKHSGVVDPLTPASRTRSR